MGDHAHELGAMDPELALLLERVRAYRPDIRVEPAGYARVGFKGREQIPMYTLNFGEVGTQADTACDDRYSIIKIKHVLNGYQLGWRHALEVGGASSTHPLVEARKRIAASIGDHEAEDHDAGMATALGIIDDEMRKGVR